MNCYEQVIESFLNSFEETKNKNTPIYDNQTLKISGEQNEKFMSIECCCGTGQEIKICHLNKLNEKEKQLVMEAIKIMFKDWKEEYYGNFYVCKEHYIALDFHLCISDPETEFDDLIPEDYICGKMILFCECKMSSFENTLKMIPAMMEMTMELCDDNF